MITLKEINTYIRYLKYDGLLKSKIGKNFKFPWVIEVCNDIHEEEEALRLIKLLIKKKKDDVNRKDKYGYTFIHDALYTGYSQEFMIDLLKLASDNYFDINYRDLTYGDTIIHTAIESDGYIGKVAPLLKIAIGMGLDVNIKNYAGKTILDAALDPDCEYELDDEDLVEVQNLITKQNEKLKREKRKQKLMNIQYQLRDILDELTEEEQKQMIKNISKSYKKEYGNK